MDSSRCLVDFSLAFGLLFTGCCLVYFCFISSVFDLLLPHLVPALNILPRAREAILTRPPRFGPYWLRPCLLVFQRHLFGTRVGMHMHLRILILLL